MAVRIAPPSTVQQKGVEEQLSQTGLLTSVAQLAKLPITNGLVLSGVVLKAGVTTTVFHGLGRKPLGWFVTDDCGPNAAIIRRSAWDSRGMDLTALADCTVAMWVY